MIKWGRVGVMTIWMEKSHQGDGLRIFGDRLYEYEVRGGSQMTVHSDNSVDDYHICGLNCIYVAYNLTEPGSNTNKTMSRPASQNTKYRYVTMTSRYLRRVKFLSWKS